MKSILLAFLISLNIGFINATQTQQTQVIDNLITSCLQTATLCASGEIIGPNCPIILLGVAEYIQTSEQTRTAGDPFSFDTEVLNTTNGAVSPSVFSSGTIFNLSPGVYIIDYEMSFTDAGDVAIYNGTVTRNSLLYRPAPLILVDLNTVAGSSTPYTWIHGRTIEMVDIEGFGIAIAPYNTDVTLAPINNSEIYMIRLTIVKIA
jgi:hypothetical protein